MQRYWRRHWYGSCIGTSKCNYSLRQFPIGIVNDAERGFYPGQIISLVVVRQVKRKHLDNMVGVPPVVQVFIPVRNVPGVTIEGAYPRLYAVEIVLHGVISYKSRKSLGACVKRFGY